LATCQLAAGGFHDRLETEIVQPLAHHLGGQRDRRERHVGRWIEIEDEAIGLVQRVDMGLPGMDLEDAELHQGDEVPDGTHAQQLFLVLGILHRADAALQGLLRMALEKAFAGDAVRIAHHRHRPVAHVQQQCLRHPFVVARDVELGRAGGRIDYP